MSIEGLHKILESNEVISTFSATDMVSMPQSVQDSYLRHVRTYIPMNRVAEGGSEEIGVTEFEKRAIRYVKEKRAPRGYLTAEFGYGKTSTALYLWQRAEDANLVVVPPFQLTELPDLVHATYGWTRHRLLNSRPQLVDRLDELYQSVIDRSLEKLAAQYGVSLVSAQQMARAGRLKLDLQPTDYIFFFEKATALVLEAGFEGLIVLPDEIQQYIEPELQTRAGDPIAPFFNILQLIGTRERSLNFGFIMIMPKKELGVIREARGREDVLHRMKDLSLDLTNIYTAEFAENLWRLLAKQFDFEDLAERIVDPITLSALGQITSRDDLSNGPRTVINVFRRMVERFFNSEVSDQRFEPYTPIHLIDDFLNEQAIKFAGADKLRNVARQALQSAILVSNPHYAPAIKLAAAFPNTGVSLPTQRLYGLESAFSELRQKVWGELIIGVGDPANEGVTLSRLDRAEVATEWLPTTIRDMRRAFGEHRDETRERTLTAFVTLLQTHIFKNWSKKEQIQRKLTSNLSIVFEGDFQSFSNRFPKRRVHVRILWEDEPVRDAESSGDVVIEYRLRLYPDLLHEKRRQIAEPVVLDYASHTAHFTLNLMYVEGIGQQIQKLLSNVWSPYDLSPLVLINIYQMLDQKREQNAIPKRDDQVIKSGIQPDLMDNVARNLFNSQIGTPLEAAGAQITEIAVGKLLDARYGATYRSISTVSNWQSSLAKYRNALDRLRTPFERRGDVEVEGTKADIAGKFTLSNTAFDNFRQNFSDLIRVERDWTRDQEGAVRFTLHPLEKGILARLRESPRKDRVTVGGQVVELHALPISDIYVWARSQGYREEEIEAILELLSLRELTETHQQHLLRERPSQVPNVDEVTSQLRELQVNLQTLLEGFPNNNSLSGWQAELKRLQETIDQLLRQNAIDPQTLARLGRTIKTRSADVDRFASDQREVLKKQVKQIRSALRPVSADRISRLASPFSGSVAYVQQVNHLRNRLFQQAGTAKAKVDQVSEDIEKVEVALSDQRLAIHELATQAKHISEYEHRVSQAAKTVQDVELQLTQLDAWRRLVDDGSRLYGDMQQMEGMLSTQANEFEKLAREINGAISSAANKLDVLPNAPTYGERLSELEKQVRAIREQATEKFNELQNRYISALTQSGLYRSQQLERRFAYNPSAPDESYNSLRQEIAKRLADFHNQVGKVLRGKVTDLKGIFQTPAFRSLLDDDRQQLTERIDALLEASTAIDEKLNECAPYVADLEVISDFPDEQSGKFKELVAFLEETKRMYDQFARDAKILNDQLGELQLTDEEQQAFDSLPGDPNEVDLIEWHRVFRGTEDQFWLAVRSLHEKRRIRIVIERVQRSEP